MPSFKKVLGEIPNMGVALLIVVILLLSLSSDYKWYDVTATNITPINKYTSQDSLVFKETITKKDTSHLIVTATIINGCDKGLKVHACIKKSELRTFPFNATFMSRSKKLVEIH